MKVALVVLLLAVGTLVLLTAILVGRVRFPLRILLVGGAAAIAIVPIVAYLRFHPAHAFISRSSANEHWAVDCIAVGGFRNTDYDFRVHDFRASLWGPIYVGDLFWTGKYEPGTLYWSLDGTVAAATVVIEEDRREIFSVAYDFKTHRIVSHATEEMQNTEIQRLLSSREEARRLLFRVQRVMIIRRPRSVFRPSALWRDFPPRRMRVGLEDGGINPALDSCAFQEGA